MSRFIIKKVLLTTFSFVFILAIWWIVSKFIFSENNSLMPSPKDVFMTFITDIKNGTLILNIWKSLLRVLIGFGIASIAGIILGLAIGLVPFIYIILESIINFLKNIPPIAWIPLAILWFGIGELSKIYIIAYSAFFPILLNTIFGVRSIDKILLKMAKNMQLNKFYFIKEIIIPASLPSIFTGLRIGMGTGWMALIAAEMIGATSGLGFMIEESRQLLLVSRVIVGILSIGFCGFICDKILQYIEKKLVPWI
jgi:sulfonate transport system permease protein